MFQAEIHFGVSLVMFSPNAIAQQTTHCSPQIPKSSGYMLIFESASFLCSEMGVIEQLTVKSDIWEKLSVMKDCESNIVSGFAAC